VDRVIGLRLGVDKVETVRASDLVDLLGEHGSRSGWSWSALRRSASAGWGAGSGAAPIRICRLANLPLSKWTL
jgi:hypothetical protein